VRLSWARHPRDLAGVDWVILPGSKHTRADLAWLRDTGLDLAITRHAQAGGAVLGVCGGLQMLGTHIDDRTGVEGGASGTDQGLGLLPLRTRFEADKRLSLTRARFADAADTADAAGAQGVPSPWSALAGVGVQGYEIHHGQTEAGSLAQAILFDESGHALGWRQGAVLGVYLHGLFEDTAAMRALFGQCAPDLDATFDGLADFVGQHLGEPALMALLHAAPNPD
jgi:adenosylcobyric acid synthase